MSLQDLLLNPYSDLEEISLRDELDDVISGSDFGVEKHIPYIHRKIRLDKYNNPEYCICYNNRNNEGRLGCPYCDGVGKYWDEVLIPGFIYLVNKKKIVGMMDYMVNAGRNEEYEFLFITSVCHKVRKMDSIIEPHVSDDGFLKFPIKHMITYEVTEALDRRLDMGRAEFSFVVLSRTQEHTI